MALNGSKLLRAMRSTSRMSATKDVYLWRCCEAYFMALTSRWVAVSVLGLRVDPHVRRPAVYDGAGNVGLHGRQGQPHQRHQ